MNLSYLFLFGLGVLSVAAYRPAWPPQVPHPNFPLQQKLPQGPSGQPDQATVHHVLFSSEGDSSPASSSGSSEGGPSNSLVHHLLYGSSPFPSGEEGGPHGHSPPGVPPPNPAQPPHVLPQPTEEGEEPNPGQPENPPVPTDEEDMPGSPVDPNEMPSPAQLTADLARRFGPSGPESPKGEDPNELEAADVDGGDGEPGDQPPQGIAPGEPNPMEAPPSPPGVPVEGDDDPEDDVTNVIPPDNTPMSPSEEIPTEVLNKEGSHAILPGDIPEKPEDVAGLVAVLNEEIKTDPNEMHIMDDAESPSDAPAGPSDAAGPSVVGGLAGVLSDADPDPSHCADKRSDCGQLSSLCGDTTFGYLMTQQCSEQCGLCQTEEEEQQEPKESECKDTSARVCNLGKNFCTTFLFGIFTRKACPKACGTCVSNESGPEELPGGNSPPVGEGGDDPANPPALVPLEQDDKDEDANEPELPSKPADEIDSDTEEDPDDSDDATDHEDPNHPTTPEQPGAQPEIAPPSEVAPPHMPHNPRGPPLEAGLPSLVAQSDVQDDVPPQPQDGAGE